MSRYAFFQDAHGRPDAGTESKHAPVALLRQLGEVSLLRDDGKIAWTDWYYGFEAIFSSLIIKAPGGDILNEIDSKSIIRAALSDVAKKSPGKPLLAKDVLNAADKRASAHFRLPQQTFVVLTTLSVKELPANQLRIGNSTIKSLKSRGTRFSLPKVVQRVAPFSAFGKHLESTKYQLIRITTPGRTIFEAVDEALDDLSLIRAIWSLSETQGTWITRIGSSDRKGIGVVHEGPLHTVHHVDGKPAHEEFYWFDPEYTSDLDLFEPKDWRRLEKDRRWILKQLSRLPYGKDLKELFGRYIAALDATDPGVAFLKLWTILEKLTDTVGAQYDETIRRACWIYSEDDRSRMKEILQLLRHRRNRYVHTGHADRESEDHTYMLKNFVEPHLVRLLHNPFDVQNFKEYAEVLCMPTDVRTLAKKRIWLSRALEYRAETN